MFLVQCEELRTEHLTPVLVVTMPLRLLILVMDRLYWGLQVTSSFSIWGCVMKGCFERGIIFWRAKSRLKGIEDFSLEHWFSLYMHLHTYWLLLWTFFRQDGIELRSHRSSASSLHKRFQKLYQVYYIYKYTLMYTWTLSSLSPSSPNSLHFQSLQHQF